MKNTSARRLQPLRFIGLALIIAIMIIVVSIFTSVTTLAYIKLDSQGALPRSLSLGVHNILKERRQPQQETPNSAPWLRENESKRIHT